MGQNRFINFTTIGSFAITLSSIAAMLFALNRRSSDLAAPKAILPARFLSAVDSLKLSHTVGTSAPDTLIELTDFLCSACRTSHQLYGARIDSLVRSGRLVHRVIVAPLQAGSVQVAVASECAWRVDSARFWVYNDILFDAQRAIASSYPVLPTLTRLARLAGIDSARVESCVLGERSGVATRYSEVLNVARSARVPFTPIFGFRGRAFRVSALDTVLATLQR
jgi:protein-disulfide isomerase